MVIAVLDQRLPFARLLHRGLRLPEYLDAADRALARVVPFEASCWLSLDPGTLLPTSHFSRDYGVDQLLELAANEYLEEDVNRFADLARSPRPVGILSDVTGGHLERSRRYVEYLTPSGSEPATNCASCSGMELLPGVQPSSTAGLVASGTRRRRSSPTSAT